MPEPLQDEANQSPYEKMLQDCLRGELRVVNTGLPQSQKRQSKENKLLAKKINSFIY
jgi:hypothetical protein